MSEEEMIRIFHVLVDFFMAMKHEVSRAKPLG